MIIVLAHDTSLRPRALAHAPSRIVSPIADDALAASAESEPAADAAASAESEPSADAAADDDVEIGANLASSRMTRAYAHARSPTHPIASCRPSQMMLLLFPRSPNRLPMPLLPRSPNHLPMPRPMMMLKSVRTSLRRA